MDEIVLIRELIMQKFLKLEIIVGGNMENQEDCIEHCADAEPVMPLVVKPVEPVLMGDVIVPASEE